MNNEQKRYTVQKIEKYNKEVKEAESKISTNEFIIGLGAVSIVGSMATQSNWTPYITMLMGLISAFSLGSLVEAICNKAGLQNQIANLEYQLEMANLENDSKGMGR